MKETKPLNLWDIEVYLDGKTICFINHNTVEKGTITVKSTKSPKVEPCNYVSRIEPLNEMTEEREALYLEFFEKNFELITEYEDINSPDYEFNRWVKSDNVVKNSDKEYVTQCSQYRIKMNYEELKSYFKKEYKNG